MKKRNGFTVVEVLVALSVFSFSLVGVTTLLISNITIVSGLEDRFIALNLAQGELDKIEASRNSFWACLERGDSGCIDLLREDFDPLEYITEVLYKDRYDVEIIPENDGDGLSLNDRYIIDPHGVFCEHQTYGTFILLFEILDILDCSDIVGYFNSKFSSIMRFHIDDQQQYILVESEIEFEDSSVVVSKRFYSEWGEGYDPDNPGDV